jgi:nucleotide-binding universal stress UspA family protein
MTTLPKYTKILVPTDGSEYSYAAGKHAVYIAKEIGAKIFALNVINSGLAFHAGIHYAESKSEMEQEGKKATGRIKDLCGEYGVDCEELIVDGKPQDVIVEVANKANIDCIVIGSLGMSAIERVLIGSVSDNVLRHARCPVLMVRK